MIGTPRPPAQVTAADFVREFKMLCNPVSPVGAPGYFTSTIVGMKAYCDGFAKVKGTVAGDRGYVNGHPLAGVVAQGPADAGLQARQPGAGLPQHPRDGLLLRRGRSST